MGTNQPLQGTPFQMTLTFFPNDRSREKAATAAAEKKRQAQSFSKRNLQ